MEIWYALINFLILAAIVFLAGRKIIARIFSGRRERINKELDEAEREDDIAPPVDISDIELPEDDTAKKASAIRAAAEASLQQNFEEERDELEMLRLDMLCRARDSVVDALCEKAKEKFAKLAQTEEFKQRERAIANVIYERMELTAGDLAYLLHHNVLYVTLTSARPLDEDIVERLGKRAEELLAKIGGKASYWVKTDPSLIGGFQFRIGDTVYDGTGANMLYRVANSLKSEDMGVCVDANSFVDTITAAIDKIGYDIDEYQLGRVISVSDGICWLDGLADVMYGELVEFMNGDCGMVMDIEPDRIGCAVFGSYEHIESGSRVRHMGRMASVPVGEAMLGRVVDALGMPIDGKGNIHAKESRPVEFRAPSITERKSVFRPMHTGIKAVDALVPIGRGQRELIIGDRQTGKSAIAIDAIINQKGKNTVCIYVAIGQKDTTVAELQRRLQAAGAMEYTTIVCANASSSASLQYIAPFAGAAMGEYFMYGGKDVLIVYDDLSKHAVAYRELSLLLHRPSGREAFPGDVFYLHSRLLERSAQLSDEMGGGSMTALPLVETQSGDISAYIPTNVISITDGQIFLDSDLFNEGQRPAVNVGLSVSRVGGAAQTKLLKQVAAKIRMNLAQYRELQSFSQFGTDVDDATKKVLDAGERMMAVLRQQRYAPMTDAEIALVIYAVDEGGAASFKAADMASYEKELISYFKHNHGDIMRTLATGEKMTEETAKRVRDAVCQFEKRYKDALGTRA